MSINVEKKGNRKKKTSNLRYNSSRDYYNALILSLMANTFIMLNILWRYVNADA